MNKGYIHLNLHENQLNRLNTETEAAVAPTGLHRVLRELRNSHKTRSTITFGANRARGDIY